MNQSAQSHDAAHIDFATKTAEMMGRDSMTGGPVVEVRKVGGEWCAFHLVTGREIARSRERSWLESYLTECGMV